MKQLTEEELKQIQGGINWSASLITSIVRGINSILELGRSLGSAIRRIQYGQMCSI